jgi:hypothetical protein
MPDRKNTIVTVEDMQEILENLEMDITRVIRTNAPRHGED